MTATETSRIPIRVAVGFAAGMDRHGPWEPVPMVVTMGGAGRASAT